MHAGMCMCATRCLLKGKDKYKDRQKTVYIFSPCTDTHTHLVTYLWSVIHTRRDSPSPSSAFHVMSSSLTPCLSVKPFFWIVDSSGFTVHPFETCQPQRALLLRGVWPINPEPSLLYSCVQHVGISVYWLCLAGMSDGSMCPWNPWVSDMSTDP